MSKSLKNYLREKIDGRLSEVEGEECKLRSSLDILNGHRIDNMHYSVRTTYWEDDHWMTVDSEGSLEKAMKTAVSEFEKKVGPNCSGSYNVEIVLEDLKMEVPREYWEMFVDSE
ncbi:MAG: hypothetical protein KJ592_04460 [Nanoarchaeota archaeon]|nr:hypothetical protein [Nanoarchaeota archaeon]